MTKILTPQTKNLEPSNQVTNKDEKVFKFKNEEHQLIYRAFLDILENPETLEKQTKQEIEKKKQKLKEELPDREKQELQNDLELLDKRLERLQNGNEKKIFTFISKNHEGIFKKINHEDIKLLSEENFSQLLLSVFKEIREQGLAREEKLNNDKIQQIITKCVADIRGTEAKDSSIKFVLEMLLLLIGGIKIDPKNISGSFMDGMKEKIPFLGKDKKEEDEPPLSDEEMVKTFLSKSLLPITLFAFSALIFGTGPIALAISGGLLVWTEVSTIKSLFSNNKKGTLYDPSSQDKDDTEKRAKLNGKILEGIDDILKTPVTGVEKGTPVPEQVTSVGKEKSEQQPVPEQISQVGNEKSEQRDQSWTGKQTKGKTTERQR
ncbi:hypothetical protein INQ25_04795 [Wolbachia endosymbiont of Rhagoletis cerasi]|uniref:hypothetical protein n=1 Tax=Wolbachia endosymbiont of Rhagoletis cerasi TaxID=225363 RepID=UPI001BD60611|nr:hypothetical protein [Wolbachia endosymbiont of Rhagoletis cerasi]MBS9530689.1 hypothetical protein [Wolbachia endosymbiont of Rhagoletis cerasi]